MRKLIFVFTVLLFSQFSFGQSVQDNATIPVSVTLNSILRLTVTTGGNIQFVFNTMEQYNNGILNTLGTTTTFTVSSSTDFTVTMGAEDATFLGVETGATSLFPLAIVEYDITGTGLGKKVTAADPLQVITAGDDIVTAGVAGGLIADRTYSINWQAGVTLPVLDFPADVYVTNVFLNLQPIP